MLILKSILQESTRPEGLSELQMWTKKRALKSRISANNDVIFEYGDKVFFKEKDVKTHTRKNGQAI